ncbi:MAG: autotransporter-associated beta strand repeat-containing protein [Verrucomicrobiota bacterium]
MSASAARAVDGVWTSTASGGLWSDTANWSGGIVADGTDAVADLSTLNIAAHTAVNFDAPRTLGVLRFGDTATTVFNWTLNNNANAANILTLAGATPAILVNTGVFTNNVQIAGTAGFAVNGGTAASSLALGAANTFGGDVSVNAGTVGNLTLLLNNVGALGGSISSPNSVVLVANAATRALLNLNTSGATYPAYNNLIMRPTGASASSRAELRSVSGNATWNGSITLDGISGSALPRSDIYCDASASTFTLNGNISGVNNYVGQFVLRGANTGIINGNINVPGVLMGKDDAGTWTLTAPNNVWASLSILNGTLRLGANNVLPATTPMTFGSSGAAILDLNGYSQILSGNIAATGSNARRITNSVLAATQSLITYSTASDVSCAVPIAGKTALLKLGTSILTLSAANTYLGDTVVSNGTLAVASTGSIGGSTNIIIAPGATLSPVGIALASFQKLLPVDGTAILGGVVTLSSGALTLNYPVGSPGLTISAGNLILNGSSVVTVNVNGSLVSGQSYQLVSAINGGQVSGTAPASVILNGVSGMSGYLVISNSQLYLTMDTKPLITSQLPVAYTNQSTLYAGATPSFAVTVGGLPPFSYRWFTNGVLNSTATNASMTWQGVGLGAISAYCIVTNTSGAATSSVWNASVIAPPTTPYPVTVMSSNLVGYWRLNEPDNGLGDNNANVLAHDYWGGNNGLFNNTYLGMPGYSQSTDPTTTAALFGIANTANCAASGIGGVDFAAPTNTSKAFTVEAWVAGISAPISPSGIVAKGYGGGGEQFDLDANGNSFGFRFFVRDASGTARVASSSIVPKDSVWHHVVGVCDQPNGAVRLYVDGVAVASASIPTNGGILAATSPMSIGARYSSAAAMANNTLDNQFYGYVNDVAIYNTALSASQIQAHYFAAGIAPTITSQPPASTNVNQNGTLIVAATASGTQPLFYKWFDVNAGSYLPTQTNATLVISNLQADNSYYLTVTNAYGSIDSSLVTVTVSSGFNVSLTPNVSGLKVYAGLPVTYTVNAAGTEPFHYRWLKNGVLVPGATNATYALAVPLGNSSVSCVVSNSFNGLSSQTLGPVTVTGVVAPTNDYQLSVISHSPVAYWPLNESDNGLNDGNPGAILYDYVGGHNCVLTNTYLGTPGFNTAMYPDLTAPLFGVLALTNSYALEADASAGGLANINFARPTGANAAFSVEAWVNLTNAISAASIVAKGVGHSEQFALDVYNGGFRFVFRDGAATARDSGVSAAAVVGRWYHLVGVFDGANGSGRLFVNGTNVVSNTGLATGLGLWTPVVNPNLPAPIWSILVTGLRIPRLPVSTSNSVARSPTWPSTTMR